MTHVWPHWFVLAACCCAGSGTMSCALTTKADLVETRYFNPEWLGSTSSGVDGASARREDTRGASIALRLGRISSGPNLRERIAYRDSDYELGYYEELRWTERPETYVRRQLSHSLFEVHGMHRVLVGPAPTLDVEVTAFDELRLKSVHAARIQTRVILYDDQGVILEKTFTVDQPVHGASTKIENVVAAMSRALRDACEQITLAIETALNQRVAAPSEQSHPTEHTQ